MSRLRVTELISKLSEIDVEVGDLAEEYSFASNRDAHIEILYLLSKQIYVIGNLLSELYEKINEN